MNSAEASLPKARLSFDQAIAYILSLIEVSFHTLLYLRNVYPAHTFKKVQKWGAPVWENRHPDVQLYIRNVVRTLESSLRDDAVKSVSLVIKNGNTSKILERFLFRIWQMIAGVQNFQAHVSVDGAWTNEEMTMHCRAALVNLTAVDAKLPRLNEDLDNPTFSILLELREDGEPMSNQQLADSPPWIVAEEQDSDARRGGSLHPIRGLDCGIVKFSVAAQDCRDIKT